MNATESEIAGHEWSKGGSGKNTELQQKRRQSMTEEGGGIVK